MVDILPMPTWTSSHGCGELKPPPNSVPGPSIFHNQKEVCFDNEQHLKLSVLSETVANEKLSLVSVKSEQKNSTDAAKQAVCDMGIPEHLVQLAIDIQRLDQGSDFTNVMELLDAADEIASSPEKQAQLAHRLYLATSKADQAKDDAPPVQHSPPVIQEVKMEVRDECATLSAEVPKAAELRAEKGGLERLKELALENRKLKERKLCRACRGVELATSGITFLPCGHFITCEKCSEKFDDCPACGKNIMGTVRTFLS